MYTGAACIIPLFTVNDRSVTKKSGDQAVTKKMRQYVTILNRKSRGTWICKWHINGKPQTKAFKTSGEAEAHKKIKLHELRESGTKGQKFNALDDQTKISLFTLMEHAGAKGYEPWDAIRHYDKHLSSRGVKSINVTKAVELCLEDKLNEGIAQRSHQSLRSVLRRFAFRKGRSAMANIRHPDITKFVDGYKIVLRTRVGYMTDLRTFFSWGMQKGYCEMNPVIAAMPGKSAKKRIMNTKRGRRKEQVLTPKECAALLSYCESHEPTLTQYPVILMFAGIRPEREGPYIDWDDIITDHITVDASIAKDGETRIIEPLTPNLAAWITFLKERGVGHVTNLKRKWNIAKLSIGRKWPHDCLRHTYASYHFAMFKDAGLTAKNLGHPNPTLLRKDYNNAVTEAQAKKFWDIMP